MATWGQILGEIQNAIQSGDVRSFDNVRNKYIKFLADYTKRDTIIYATRWTSGDAPPNLVSITDEDVHAFMEALSGLNNKNLDLILHTGGGSAEATDAIVSYLRQKYKHIRIIIPQAAMSAGTMLACAADIIVMGNNHQ
jgi:ClpP class serine protease